MNESDIVPGMADAIESRRIEMQLSPGTFADLVGVSRPIARYIRMGLRREYNQDTVFGVARALAWPNDWYERLQDGEDAANFPGAPTIDAVEIRAAAAEILAATQRLLAALDPGTTPPAD